jgi:predicted transcriptional regulator
MAATAALTTQIPMDLKQALDEVCRRYGLLTSHVVEQALREKVEDLIDAHDLEEAQRTAVGFREWADVEAELRKSNKL